MSQAPTPRPHRGSNENTWGSVVSPLGQARTHVFCSYGTLTFPAKITKQLNTQKDSITGLKKTPLHVPLLKVQSVWESVSNTKTHSVTSRCSCGNPFLNDLHVRGTKGDARDHRHTVPTFTVPTIQWRGMQRGKQDILQQRPRELPVGREGNDGLCWKRRV